MYCNMYAWSASDWPIVHNTADNHAHNNTESSWDEQEPHQAMLWKLASRLSKWKTFEQQMDLVKHAGTSSGRIEEAHKRIEQIETV